MGEGRVSREDVLEIIRGERKIGESEILTMKHLKVDINEAQTGKEFGVVFSTSIDFKVGDMLISHR